MGLRIKKEEELKIVGMHCSTCASTVSKAIKGVQGVEDVNVNLASGEAKIVVQDKRKLKDIINAVRKAGYDVITQKFNIIVEVSEEEILKVKEITEGIDGVISVRAGRDNLLVEVNPMTTSPETVIEELKKRGYKVKVSNLKQSRKSDFKDLLTRLVISSIFTSLVLLFPSPVLQLIFSLPVQFYSGLRFHKGMIRAFRNKTTNMDVLVSLSSNIAWFYSLFSFNNPFFSASSLLITFILLGKTLEAYLKERASEHIVSLLNVKARKVTEKGEIEVNASDLKPGDIVTVKSGEVIPADGVVDDGEGYVDESIYTGEAVPTRKKKGDPVVGGSVLNSGFLRVYVTRTGERTYLFQVVEAVREAEAIRLPIQQLVDKISEVFVPTIIAVSITAFLTWFYILHFPLSFSVLIAVAVLASACPCGFGLATPMAIIVGLRKLLKKGIVVRHGEALEKLKEVEAFVFDKTGTITKGVIKVSRYEGEVELASSLEKLSNHPVARAIATLGKERHDVREFTEFKGEGVYGKVDGKDVIVGKREFVMKNCEGDGKDADVLVCVNGRISGYIWLEDEIKEEAVKVVSFLKEQGYEVIVATGDSSNFADRVGETLGVKVHKGLSPDDKVELIRSLSKRVAFVGDGVNDAMALKEAYVGIALSTGTEIAKYAGDIIIPSLEVIPSLLKQSKRTVRKIKENIAWALAYNSVLVPIASGMLYPFYLPPEYAALAMSMNSVSIVLWSFVQ
ncbi:heavy metal translocating P-type ATPase [Stygiolobus caldivivus]|uniref:Copper-translocating P-type ATPase n=1 Tax=Stygiolobus caldivivus TaxID=2824673 RepID=A0A8D5U8U5_9CREN|nr:cation-translocating P-type ATPase [Stygiolobus caldivivus]BCU71018.1 copper-translocating P-type ATPase [Stygiolobus caldivivus]